MTTLKHLITSEDVTARSVVQLNAAAKKLNLAIPLAELQKLRPLLGVRLFDELLLFIQAATPDVLDPLAKLADEVKDMLSAWTVVKAWPSMPFHVSDAGFVIKNGKDVSTRADNETSDKMLVDLIETAEFYTSEFVKWVEANKGAFPSYAPIRVVASVNRLVGGLDC